MAVVDICGGEPIKISVHISEITPRKQDQAPYQAQTESAHLFAFLGENLEFKPGETCETDGWEY